VKLRKLSNLVSLLVMGLLGIACISVLLAFALAQERRRFGYRRLDVLLRREGHAVNR